MLVRAIHKRHNEVRHNPKYRIALLKKELVSFV